MENEYPVHNTTQSNTAVLDFANYIASLTASKIAGVFLELKAGKLQPVLRNIGKKTENAAASGSISHMCCGKCRQKSEHVKNACDKKEKEERNVQQVSKAIIKESRFSDLLIVDAQMSFDNNQTGVLSELTIEVLTKSECPVIIAPYSFDEIEEIVFAYDGSASAVFAIKQFAWLFPGLTDKKLTVLQVTDSEDSSITDRHNILGLLQKHYSAAGFRTLQGTASDELYKYLQGKRNTIVIMGAFGAHLLQPLRLSTAVPLVKTINLPLFIAHHQ